MPRALLFLLDPTVAALVASLLAQESIRPRHTSIVGSNRDNWVLGIRLL